MPPRFFQQSSEDFAACDVLIVLGTSLTVHPFASLIDRVRPSTPRLLVNRVCVGESQDGGRTGFVFEPGSWDVFWETSCDTAARQLAELLGVHDELGRLTSAREAGPPHL